jgi:methylase of polypeptide subunit release factors
MSADFPPPRFEEGRDTAPVRKCLQNFLEWAVDHYDQLLLNGDPLEANDEERELLPPLAAVGLVEEIRPGVYRPRARVFELFEKFLATDLLARQSPDQVFQIMFEQVYVVRNTSIGKGDDVLDLCTGSGVLGLFASDVAGSVTSIDISQRALDFAEFNRALNVPERTIEYHKGSLFEPLDPERMFDVIQINPPFDLVPPGETYFLHSDGGIDGLDVTRACLEAAPRRLKPGGRFEIITRSPGSVDSPALLGLLRDAFPEHLIEVHLLDVDKMRNHVAQFRKSRGYIKWACDLEEMGYTHNHCLFCRATPADEPDIKILAPHEEVEACLRRAAVWG